VKVGIHSANWGIKTTEKSTETSRDRGKTSSLMDLGVEPKEFSSG
jgi:hypothetical protein